MVKKIKNLYYQLVIIIIFLYIELCPQKSRVEGVRFIDYRPKIGRFYLGACPFFYPIPNCLKRKNGQKNKKRREDNQMGVKTEGAVSFVGQGAPTGVGRG